MFINSIFLPKTISDQTVPEGSFGQIGNFSHLFSNVFRIVNDDQESPLPFQSASLNPESVQSTPNELLKVSLFSDNQLTLENTNISMIVSAFLAKLNPGENGEELVDINKVKANEKIPKYFSLSKDEFIKEIKNIIETLKSGDPKSLENVEISLIANGQSIKINPLTTNIGELENWANGQLQSNSDFEILVKSGLKKLSVDVEPVKKEISKTDKLVELISNSTDDDFETGTKYTVDKNLVDNTHVLKNSAGMESASKQPLEVLKQTITPVGDKTVKQEIPALQKQGNPPSTVDLEIIFDKNMINDGSVIIKSEVQGKVPVENILNTNSELLQEFNPGTQKGLPSKKGISSQKENILTAAGSLSQKNIIAEKQADLPIKNLTNEIKIKPNVLKSDESFIKTRMFNQTNDFNVREDRNPEKMITLQANQKTNLVSANKNTVLEKGSVNDLMEKTNVKEIDVNIQKVARTSFTNSHENETIVNKAPNKNYNPEIKTVQKPVSPKMEPTKTSVYNQRTEKVNSGNEQVAKSIVENRDLEPIESFEEDSVKPKLESNISETSKKMLTTDLKTQQKPVGVKSSSQIIENETVKNQNRATAKVVVKENAQESIKESIALKTNTGTINKEIEKIELNSSNNSKTILKNLTERSLIENLRTSLKENISLTKTQSDNKSVKVDLMQRRVYSQIPRLEVIGEENVNEKLKNPEQNIDTNKNIRMIHDPVKSASSATETRPNNEKQVWVKVSLEKPEVENGSEVKKQALQQSKITVDTNNDSINKDTKQNNFSEKESHESKNIKQQNISVETAQNTEQKPVGQNQNVNNQQDLITNIKLEIKTEHNAFKSALHSEETGFSSRTTEMVEKIKVISSSELVREVYKVFESGEKQSIVLRLVPKELGSIKIMLDTIDNVLTAKVEVESESVGHIIRNNVDQLKQSLLQSGVHVNSINISYHNPDQKQNGFQNHKRKNPSHQLTNDFEEVDESLISKKMGYNTYEYLA